MAKLKKPRNKAYRQRPSSLHSGLDLIAQKHAAAEDQRPIRADDLTDLGTAYWLALDVMLKGDSREDDWCVVVCSLNIALILAERGLGKEYEPYIVKALDGAFRASIRARRTGVWRFDGEAIIAIREAFAVHDEQVKLATKEEMRQALLEVRSRIDAGSVYREAA